MVITAPNVELIEAPSDTQDGIRPPLLTIESTSIDANQSNPPSNDQSTETDQTTASTDVASGEQATNDIEMVAAAQSAINVDSKSIEYPTKETSSAPAIDESLLVPIAELMTQAPYASSLNGLSSAECAARLARDGPNSFEQTKSVPLWLAYFYQIANLLMMLLITSSAIAYGLGEYIEGTAIMVVVVINVNLAVLTEAHSESALAALMALSQPTANVVRDGGKVQNIDSKDLVVGDVIKLDCGDVVPADARVIEAHSLDINEMILTGESLPVRKHVAPSRADVTHSLTSPNMLLSGTNVQGGRGMAMIVATGARTRLGEIARLVTENANKPKVIKTGPNGETILEKEPNWFVRVYRKVFAHQPAQTNMQQSIAKLGGYLSLVAIIICGLVLAIGIPRNHKNPEHPDDPVWLGVLLVAVALAVSAVPEGLPLAVTVALSLGGQRLMRQNALVRRIAAVESLGTVNVICSDKTGTLTEGSMSVVAMCVSGEMFATTGATIRRADEPEPDILPPAPSMRKSSTMPDRRATPSSKGGFAKFLGLSPKPSSPSIQDVSTTEADTLTKKSTQTPSSTGRSMQPAAPQPSPYLRDTLLVSRVATLCSNAKLVVDEDGDVRATGNPTEAAIVMLSDKMGLAPDQALQQNPRVMELAFTSEKKMMFTLHKINGTDHLAQILGATNPTPYKADEQLYLTCGKGSTDMLLPCCTHVFRGSAVHPMDDIGRAAVLDQMEEMADQALRVIAVVGKLSNEAPKLHEGSDEDDEKDDGNDEMLWVQQKRNLVLLGLLGIADPPRANVGRAIEVARGAGIKTVMITGDYLATARAIARNIHLIRAVPTPGEQVLDCSQLRPNGSYLPDPELDELIPNVAVFARAQPRDKLEIVRSLQRQNLVVSMSGDGVNDSPALSQADIGIAMGSGTSVAKSASAIVLLDDQFPTIITAITEGRSIYANIQKFIAFLAATNGISVGFMFLCIIIGLPTPLTPLQILTINIITDGLPALALSAQPAESDVMSAPPRNRADFLIHGNLRWLCLTHALWLLIMLPTVFIIVLYWGSGKILQDDILGLVDDDDGDGWSLGCRVYKSDPPSWSRTYDPDCASDAVKRGRTAVFLLLALSENARPYTIRWLYHPFWYRITSNMTLLAATAVALTCLFIIMFVGPVQGVFGTTDLEWYDWVFVLGCTLLTVILDEIVKYFLYERGVMHKQAEPEKEPAPLAVDIPTDAALAHQAAYR